MKACVASPPIRDFYTTRHRLSALGACAVHEILRGNGHESVYFNFPPEREKGTKMAMPAELSHLEPFIIPGEYGPVSFFTEYRHFGPAMKICAERICSSSPDMVFISCFAFAYALESLELAREVKRIMPHVVTCIGGAGATVFPEYFFIKDTIDYIITGEAEISLPAFLREMEQGGGPMIKIPGVFFTGNNYENFDLPLAHTGEGGIIPVMAKTLETTKHVHLSLSVTRGCRKSCRFCSNHLTHGKKFRKIPAEKIVEGVGRLPGGKRLFINFEDDNLLQDKNYFISLLKEIRAMRKDALFSAENGLDYMLMDPALVEELAGLGFRQLNLSMASMSRAQTDRDNRPASLARLRGIVHAAEKSGFPSIIYFICGLDGDTPDHTCDTLLFLDGLPAVAGISPFYAVPGIHGYTARDIFRGLSPRLCAGSSAWPWNSTLSTKEIVTAFRLARFINFRKKKRCNDEERGLMETIMKEKRLFTLVNINGKNILTHH